MIAGRNAAIAATISNSFCDALLDYAVNRFNYFKVLFFTSLVAGTGQLAWGMFTDIAWSLKAVPILCIHAILVLGGYVCFVRSLAYVPIGLVGLIEAGSLFLTFIIDAAAGYIVVTPYFVAMFLLFVFAVVLFIRSCADEQDMCLKNVRMQGILWVLISVLLYVAAPYLVKSANAAGANEIAINLTYYMLAIPYFAWGYKKAAVPAETKISVKWWQNIWFLCGSIGILEALYYVCETYSFVNDAPTIVVVIEQVRIFLVFGLSVLLKTDRFTLQKAVALILGIFAVTGIYLS